MPNPFEPILKDIFRVSDTCNAYLIVRNDRAIAIDPGSGTWLEHLDEIGVKHLDWVLLTHTHRDQCAGLYRLTRKTTQLAVPAIERHLVEDVETFWHSRQVYHNYNQVDDFLSLPRSVPVDRALEDFDVFEWQDLRLEVVPAPGHSPGHIALTGQLGGKRIAFTGDMIEAPHHTPSVHCTQYGYCDTAGGTLLIHSLHHLLEHEPDLLLPGRGPIIDQPKQACENLIASLRGFCREMYGEPETADQQGFRPLSPRLLTSQSGCCSFYVVLNGKGHAVLIDVGYPHGIFGASLHSFGYRTRFLPTALNILRKQHGVTNIDAVLVTHYHDDHIIGIPYLQKKFGTPVWCLDRIAPILRRPTEFNMPCPSPAR